MLGRKEGHVIQSFASYVALATMLVVGLMLLRVALEEMNQ
jgi:hypothetical protein